MAAADRHPSTHVSLYIDAAPDVVYRYAGDPRKLPTWAAGLASSEVGYVDGRWQAASPMGPITIEFAPRNAFGVLDHVVTLPDGERVLNPMRVVADGDGCEVVFTIRRREMSEEELARDAAAVAADLERLRGLLEGGATAG